jgi:hypothetical protein
MEMIDVLTKLKEIAESKPELVKDAVENVEKTNPKAVTEGGMKDYLHDEAEKLSREEFLKKHGESLAGFYDAINGTEEAVEGKIPAGLKAYQDKKAGKEKEDKKEKYTLKKEKLRKITEDLTVKAHEQDYFCRIKSIDLANQPKCSPKKPGCVLYMLDAPAMRDYRHKNWQVYYKGNESS